MSRPTLKLPKKPDAQTSGSEPSATGNPRLPIRGGSRPGKPSKAALAGAQRARSASDESGPNRGERSGRPPVRSGSGGKPAFGGNTGRPRFEGRRDEGSGEPRPFRERANQFSRDGERPPRREPSDRFERPERSARPDRFERPERFERSERSDFAPRRNSDGPRGSGFDKTGERAPGRYSRDNDSRRDDAGRNRGGDAPRYRSDRAFEDRGDRRFGNDDAPRRDRFSRPEGGSDFRSSGRGEDRPRQGFNDRPNDRRDGYTNDRPRYRSEDRPNFRSDDRPRFRSDSGADSRPDSRPNSGRGYGSDFRSSGRGDDRPRQGFNDRPNDRRDGYANDRPRYRSDDRPNFRSDDRPQFRSDSRPDSRPNSGRGYGSDSRSGDRYDRDQGRDRRDPRAYGDRPSGDRPYNDRPYGDRPRNDSSSDRPWQKPRQDFDRGRSDERRSDDRRGDERRGDSRGNFERRDDARSGPRPPRFNQERSPSTRQGPNKPLPPPAEVVEAEVAAPAKPRPEFPRLSKVMSERGLCSRREADEWIENGWVKVDGQVITELGSRVSPTADISIDRAAEKHQSETVTVLLNKPIGFVSGQAEDGYEPASVLIRPENRWEEDHNPLEFKLGHLRSLAPAGRLDIDSTGLLVLTQDGRIARRLVGDDSTIEKEYLVRVEGQLMADGLALLNHGLSLDGVKLKPAQVSWQNEDQLRFVLREGRKRQIRRMCELVGLKVVGLKRIRIGSVVLGKLPVGAWRYLRMDEKF